MFLASVIYIVNALLLDHFSVCNERVLCINTRLFQNLFTTLGSDRSGI